MHREPSGKIGVRLSQKRGIFISLPIEIAVNRKAVREALFPFEVEVNSLQSAESGSEHSSPIQQRNEGTFTVAVVICTRNRPELLRNCLRGIARLRSSPDELIVVDNTAGDRETQSVAREFGAHYIVEPVQGLSRARNRAWKETSSDIIAYLDDDAVPDEQWLSLILEPFTDPSVAIVTGDTISSPSVAGHDQGSVRTLCNKDPLWFEAATFGGLGIGANMALRRGISKDWKGFDERLGRGAPFIKGGEEHHAFAHLIDLGYTAVHTPTAFVVHPWKAISVDNEASNAIAYSWLLFTEFPGHRIELIKFLLTRLRHKPVSWRRKPPVLGPVITSGWKVRIKAGLAGTILYLRSRKAPRGR